MKRLPPLLLLMIIAFATLLAATAHGQSAARDRRLIAYAKNLRASKLDSRLPGQRFLIWFRSVVGTGAKTEWEINDCGEQTGNPRDGSSINPPLCAQAHATLGDGRNVYVLILVGTHKAGIKGKPIVWSLSVDDHGTDKSPAKLRGLVAALRK